MIQPNEADQIQLTLYNQHGPAWNHPLIHAKLYYVINNDINDST